MRNVAKITLYCKQLLFCGPAGIKFLISLRKTKHIYIFLWTFMHKQSKYGPLWNMFGGKEF